MRPHLSCTLMLALGGLLSLSACGDKGEITPGEADADTDADSDTDTDSDTDADTDVDTADWSHCPGSEAYLGDADWDGMVEATSGAIYCSAWNEDRSLEEELAALGKLRIPEGEWALPVADGTYDFALPVCVARPEGLPQPETVVSGSTTVTSSTFSGNTYVYIKGSQDLEEDDGAEWVLEHTIVLVAEEGEVPPALKANGGPADEDTGAGIILNLYEAGGSSFDDEALLFEPCSVSSWAKNLHTVTFEGGEVSLELWLGDNLTSTAPGKFSLAEGSLDGTSFSVSDRFRLIYNPGHHHFDRNFGVLFDEPIGEACGLRVDAIDGVDDGITATVSTVDCGLAEVEAREVTEETFTLD